MSRREAIAFITAVMSDSDLKARFTAASHWDDIAAIATELGVELSPDDIAEVLNDGELDERDLEGVAGGGEIMISEYMQMQIDFSNTVRQNEWLRARASVAPLGRNPLDGFRTS